MSIFESRPGELAPHKIAFRAIQIAERSIAEALAFTGAPDWLSDEDAVMWLPHEKRGNAAAYYATEYDVPFTKVQVRREYMRIDLDAIRDLAADMACDDGYEDDDSPVAHTWEDGFRWQVCKRGDERAVAFWRCEWNGKR